MASLGRLIVCALAAGTVLTVPPALCPAQISTGVTAVDDAQEPPAEPLAAGPVARELSPSLGWLNTDRPLRFSDELKGHIVVLDFWTFCCINCMHILPDLEFLEEKYKNDPVIVIGVHSAKFLHERHRESVGNAARRYGIRHPVVVDMDMVNWDTYGARGWPSFVVVGADGRLVKIESRRSGRPEYVISGEGNREAIDRAISAALAEAKARGTLAERRFEVALPPAPLSASGLSFPGKVLAVEGRAAVPGRLFIADSSGNRVIETKLPDELWRAEVVRVHGSGEPGLVDGEPGVARFHDPQGMALDAEAGVLYVADRLNHAIRRIDIAMGRVATLLGNGEQSRDRVGGEGGRRGREQGIASPWDVAILAPVNEGAGDGEKKLLIAMAGTHQIWQCNPATGEAWALIGSGREDIVDAMAKDANLAQPSGLAVSDDGERLYFVDSETSSVRQYGARDGLVRTIIGTGLFDMGDVDGEWPLARLQHPLGIAVWKTDAGERLLVADTYNHKIKLVDPDKRTATVWIGAGRDRGDDPLGFLLDEPGGVSLLRAGTGGGVLFIADTNNHRVLAVETATRVVHEVVLVGLGGTADGPVSMPGDSHGLRPAVAEGGNPAGAPERSTLRRNMSAKRPGTGAPLRLELAAPMPEGHTLNPEAPIVVVIRDAVTEKPVAQRTLRADQFPIVVECGLPDQPAAPMGRLFVDMWFTTCAEEDASGTGGLCVPGEASFEVVIGDN